VAWGEVLAGGAVAVASTVATGVLALLSQRGQHEHDSEMAAAAHRHEREAAAVARRRDDLRSVYPDLLRFVLSEQVNMSRIKPVFGSEGERIPALDDAAAIDLQTRVFAYASETVKVALDELVKLRREFDFTAWQLSDADEHPREVSTSDLYMKLEAMRVAYNSKLDAMRVLVRDEMAS
jgi:hypothetical protein